MNKIATPRETKQPAGVGVPQPRPKQRSIDERPWRVIHDSKAEGQAYHKRRPSGRDRSARKARREEQRANDRAAALNASQAKPTSRKPSYKKREMDRVRMRNLLRLTRVYHTSSPTEWHEHPGIMMGAMNVTEAIKRDKSYFEIVTPFGEIVETSIPESPFEVIKLKEASDDD